MKWHNFPNHPEIFVKTPHSSTCSSAVAVTDVAQLLVSFLPSPHIPTQKRASTLSHSTFSSTILPSPILFS